jgi:putative peptide zinc metalloprotease protein
MTVAAGTPDGSAPHGSAQNGLVLRATRPVLSPGIVAWRIPSGGAPAWILHNPATGRYLRTAPRGWALLTRLDGRRTLAEALAALPPPGPGEPDDAALCEGLAGLAASGVIAFPGSAPPRQREAPPGMALLRGTLVTRFRLGDLWPVIRRAGWLLAWPYTRPGLLLGLALMAVALLLWAGRGEVVAAQLARMADASLADLAAWYLMFAASKFLHECGHAAAAARMAAAEGHRIESFPFGLAFMFLLPAPYVDVSGIWFVADRWRRAAVGLAGIWMDLLLAAAAATVAAFLAEGALRDRLCELVVIAGVSSLLFNANPLVRLDGYYVMTDLAGAPNLQGRAAAALLRVAGLLAGASRPRAGDGALAAYGLASLAWRFVIFAGVFWLAAQLHWLLGALVASVIGILYLLLPMISGVASLTKSARVRPVRAGLGAATLAAVAACLALVPLPAWTVAHGIAWNDGLSLVFAGADGQVVAVAPAGATTGTALALDNPETRRLRQQLALEAQSIAIEARLARAATPGRIDVVEERAAAVAAQDATLATEMASWTVATPSGATWEPLRAERFAGAWVRRDDARPLGALLGAGPVVIRLVLDQAQGPAVLDALAAAPELAVAVRRHGEAAALLTARAERARPAARQELPSAALAAGNGGPFALLPGENGLRTAARVYELRLVPDDAAAASPLLHGTRIEARIPLPPTPFAAQAWREARRLFQQRLGA